MGLKNNAPDAVDQTAGVLDAYGLRKEHLTEHLTELRNHLGEIDYFKVVDSKVKAALTRELNSGSGHAAKVMIPTKKRKTGAAPEGEGLEGDDDEREPEKLDGGSDKESDDGDVGGLVKMKKAKAKAKSKAKAKAGAGDDSQGATPRAAGKARGKAKAKP